MKFLCIWECDPEDWDSMIEKYGERMQREDRDTFPQPVTQWFVVGEFKAYEVWEAESLESLTEMYLTYTPEIKKMHFFPVIDAHKFIEVHRKVKGSK
jgi:hypothetical protein